MKFRLIKLILIGLLLGSVMAQEEAITPGMEKNDSKDLKPGDIAPSWALMYAPGKFEFLRTWSEEVKHNLCLIRDRGKETADTAGNGDGNDEEEEDGSWADWD
jgi:hypothetical protein